MLRVPAYIMSGTVLATLDALADDGWLTHRKAVNTFVICPCFTGPSHCVTANKSEVQTAKLLIYDFVAFWVFWVFFFCTVNRTKCADILYQDLLYSLMTPYSLPS